MRCKFKDKFSDTFRCNNTVFRREDEYCYYHKRVMEGLIDPRGHKDTLKELPKVNA